MWCVGGRVRVAGLVVGQSANRLALPPIHSSTQNNNQQLAEVAARDNSAGSGGGGGLIWGGAFFDFADFCRLQAHYDRVVGARKRRRLRERARRISLEEGALEAAGVAAGKAVAAGAGAGAGVGAGESKSGAGASGV